MEFKQKFLEMIKRECKIQVGGRMFVGNWLKQSFHCFSKIMWHLSFKKAKKKNTTSNKAKINYKT